VQVDVSVLDGRHRPVRGLTAADFTVLEDGQPREIQAFSEVYLPDRVQPREAAWTREVPTDVWTNDVARQEGRLVILLMDRSIKPGDVIAVNDPTGRESFGQIRKIGIRAISVVTRDRKEYLIPNENLMVNQVVNWSYSSREVRVKAPVGVAYGTDLELAEKLLLEAAVGAPRVLSQPAPNVRLMAFGANAIEFEIRFWITDPEEGVSGARSEVLKRVWHLFKEHSIELPFPQLDLNLRDSKAFQQLAAAIAHRNAGSDEA